MKKISCIVSCLWLLAGCSSYYASNGEKQYMLSRNGVGLVVPPPLTDSNISHFYDLPLQTKNAEVTIAPPL